MSVLCCDVVTTEIKETLGSNIRKEDSLVLPEAKNEPLGLGGHGQKVIGLLSYDHL